MTETYTSAPESYDGFGTRTVRIAGYDKRDRPIRLVETPDEHAEWQRNRYYSGAVYLVVSETEWRKLVDLELVTETPRCQAELWFDPSDPVPTCELEEGHEGPHRLPEGTTFTDRGNWRELALEAGCLARYTNVTPQDFINDLRESLGEPELTFEQVCERAGFTPDEAIEKGLRR
jgi:hypothetical protein